MLKFLTKRLFQIVVQGYDIFSKGLKIFGGIEPQRVF